MLQNGIIRIQIGAFSYLSYGQRATDYLINDSFQCYLQCMCYGIGHCDKNGVMLKAKIPRDVSSACSGSKFSKSRFGLIKTKFNL